MSDEDVVRLRATGISLRKIARQLGMSVAGVQRALARTGGPPTAVVEHWEDLPDPTQWWRLNAMERWRVNHHIPAPGVPIHDTDGAHRLCCLAHGVDPDYRPDFGEYHFRPRTTAVDLDSWVSPVSATTTDLDDTEIDDDDDG
jgi:hypothetical protein